MTNQAEGSDSNEKSARMHQPQYYVREGSGRLYRLWRGLMFWNNGEWEEASQRAYSDLRDGAPSFDDISAVEAAVLTDGAGLLNGNLYQSGWEAAEAFLDALGEAMPTQTQVAAFRAMRQRAIRAEETTEERNWKFATDEVYGPKDDAIGDALNHFLGSRGTLSQQQFDALTSEPGGTDVAH